MAEKQCNLLKNGGGNTKTVSASTGSTFSISANTVTPLAQVTLTRGLWIIEAITELATNAGQNTGALQCLLRKSGATLAGTQIAYVHNAKIPITHFHTATGNEIVVLAAYMNEAGVARGCSVRATKIADV